MNSLKLKKIMKNNEGKKFTQEEFKQVIGTEIKFQFRRSFSKNKSPYIHLF